METFLLYYYTDDFKTRRSTHIHANTFAEAWAKAGEMYGRKNLESMFQERKIESPCPLPASQCSKANIEALWEELADVPFDDSNSQEDLTLLEEWRGFPVGTPREDIWHWFDDFYPDGVEALLYNRYERSKNYE